MNRRVFDYFEIAGKLASSRDDGRAFLLGAIGLRKDGAMVSAINAVAQSPNRQLHAEYKLSKKLDRGSVIYVARVRLLDGEFAMAKPCHDCEKVLRSRYVRRVYYTIANNEYGVLDFQ
jgi:hypothetical protein